MTQKIIVLSICSFLVFQGFAQNLKEDLVQLQQYYHQEAINCQIETRTFKDHHSVEPDLVSKGVFKRRGNDLLYEVDDVVLLYNENYSITYHQGEGIVYCGEKTSEGHRKMPIIDFTKMLSRYESIEYKGVVENNKCYILKQAQSPIPIMEFYVDQDHYKVKKIVYHYDEAYNTGAIRTEISFQYSNAKAFAIDEFSESRFVLVDQKKVRLHPRLKNHELILSDGLIYD
ncbi:MAG: hypothetical protein AAF985_16560 [Bacteroidota bacterium]